MSLSVLLGRAFRREGAVPARPGGKPDLRVRQQSLAAGLLAGAAILVAPTTAPRAQDQAPERASGTAAKPVVSAERLMVVSANPAASEAGLKVLEAGGSAADAAVAVQLVLNLVEPQSSGIGGGAFMLHWDAAARELTTLDGRETAPLAADPDYFLKPDGTPQAFDDAVPGGRSVGVPGTLALLELAHRLHGRRPWAELVAPAIRIAEEGFPVSPRLASAINGDAQKLQAFSTTTRYFLTAAGTAPEAGTVLKNPDFARTLRLIAEDGSAPFYRGEIGQALVEAVRTAPVNPGLLTAEDLAGYRVVIREPVCAPYRAYEVCGMGPPSSGGVAVAQILGLLAHLDMKALGPTVDGAHAFLEASKLAYADRDLYLADPAFVRVPLRGLLDPAYLTARAQAIRLDAAMPKAPAGNPPWREASLLLAPDEQDERPGTSHFVVVDGAGSVVSMTTTIESGFGSRLMVGGFLLNNELTDFSFAPAASGRPVANRVEGGKRPRSSMAPTIVFDRARQAPLLAIGSPGGSRIIPYVAQAIVAHLDWGMSPQDAVAMGHLVNRNGPTELEPGTPVEAWREALTSRGHEVRLMEQNSGLHAVGRASGGALLSGVDPRREGAAAGR
jgi:gamma-glutamyltranspeptidase/glutathione hydrolase